MVKEFLSRFTRVTVYLNQDDYRQLRSKLVLQGMSISEWFRQKIKEFLAEE